MVTGVVINAVARQMGRRRALRVLSAAAIAATSGVSLASANRNNGAKQRNRKKKRK